MPTALDIFKTTAPYIGPVLGGLSQRRGIGNATRRLTTGTDQAAGQIRQTGTNLRGLYSDVLARQGGVLQGQQGKLQPYEDIGLQNLQTLSQKVNAIPDKFSYSGEDFYKDPGYLFALQEGQKAINAAGNAAGNRFSGGTMKALDRYAQDYASTKFNEGFGRAKDTFGINQAVTQDQMNRLANLAGFGERATTQDVNAQGDYGRQIGEYGRNAGQAELFTGKELADLESQRAEAEAAGDLGRANSLSQMIEQGMNAYQGKDLLNTVLGKPGTAFDASKAAAGIAKTGLPTAASVIGSTGTAAMPSLAAIQAGAVPEIASSAIGLGSLPTAAGGTGGAVAGAGGGSTIGSLGAFFTNPVTIGVGAALAGAIAWKKSQAHPTADKWVQGFQNKFDQHMANINQQFQSAVQSGQLTKAQAQQLRDQAAQFAADYERTRQEFATKGGKQATVARQALNTLNQYYGPNFANYFGAMDQAIAGLRA